MFCSETLFPWQRTGQRSGTLNWAPTGTLVSGLCTGFVFQETNIIAASNNAVQQGTVAKISSRRFVWLCILFPVAPKGEMQHFYASLKINFLSCDIWTESIFRPHFLRQIKKKILTTPANGDLKLICTNVRNNWRKQKNSQSPIWWKHLKPN